jgi:hypothetical protein
MKKKSGDVFQMILRVSKKNKRSSNQSSSDDDVGGSSVSSAVWLLMDLQATILYLSFFFSFFFSVSYIFP